jgi:hypothetical protein
MEKPYDEFDGHSEENEAKHLFDPSCLHLFFHNLGADLGADYHGDEGQNHQVQLKMTLRHVSQKTGKRRKDDDE